MSSNPPAATSPSHGRLSGRTAVALDASRGIAALAVVLQHARHELLVAPQFAANPSALQNALYWITGFGHEAVVVFFVLSGTLVGGSVVRSLSESTWSWRDYLVRRLTRLYIVLVPALLLVLLWDGAGAALFPARGLYGDIVSAITVGGHTLIVHNRDAFTYAGNLAFLMTIFVPVLGSAGSLWSLSNEFWYYILFPCVALAVAQRQDSRRSLLYVSISFAILLFVSHEIVEWMIVWLLGVAALRAPRIRLSPARSRLLIAAAFLLFVMVAAAERTLMNMVSLPGDIAVGSVFSLLLYTVFCHDSTVRTGADRPRSAATFKGLAGFSYTLYLLHEPPLVFANAWLIQSRHSLLQPTPENALIMLAFVSAVTAYAYVGSRFTEARTDDLRRAVQKFSARNPFGIARHPPARPPSPRFLRGETG